MKTEFIKFTLKMFGTTKRIEIKKQLENKKIPHKTEPK